MPWQKYQKAWADFTFETDFTQALGVLSSVSGRVLMHQQVQFIWQYVTFLKSSCILAEAKPAPPSRKERKISPEWCTIINNVRSGVADLKDFLANPRVQAQGILFKDPEVLTVAPMLGQTSAGPSLQVKLDMAPLQDTMKAAQTSVESMALDWEQDTENFIKMIEGWQARGWKEQKDSLLQPQNRAPLSRVLDGQYTKVRLYSCMSHLHLYFEFIL